MPIPIMIDNCITSLSDTMQCIYKTVEIGIGNVSQSIQVLGFQRRPTPGVDEEWMYNQFNCLPTIARIAREGLISCYTYSELRHEAWKRPGSFPSNVIGLLFSGVPYVDAAVERSYFFQTDLSEYLSSDQMILFCKWLINTDFTKRIDDFYAAGKYPEFLLANLRNVDRYRKLCASLGERQYPDAFHLWTAEVNGAKYFLTTDRKFIRGMTQSNNMDLPCLPIGPEQLLEVLKVNARDPFPHPENTLIDIFGNPL